MEFLRHFKEAEFDFYFDHLNMLAVSRGQTTSIWCVLMQMDVGTELWRVEVTDPPPHTLAPDTFCQAGNVKSPESPSPCGNVQRACGWELVLHTGKCSYEIVTLSLMLQTLWSRQFHFPPSQNTWWPQNKSGTPNINWYLFSICFDPSDQSGEVLLHVDYQQLQLLSWGDGWGHQELHLLFRGQWQAEMVGWQNNCFVCSYSISAIILLLFQVSTHAFVLHWSEQNKVEPWLYSCEISLRYSQADTMEKWISERKVLDPECH